MTDIGQLVSRRTPWKEISKVRDHRRILKKCLGKVRSWMNITGTRKCLRRESRLNLSLSNY